MNHVIYKRKTGCHPYTKNFTIYTHIIPSHSIHLNYASCLPDVELITPFRLLVYFACWITPVVINFALPLIINCDTYSMIHPHCSWLLPCCNFVSQNFPNSALTIILSHRISWTHTWPLSCPSCNASLKCAEKTCAHLCLLFFKKSSYLLIRPMLLWTHLWHLMFHSSA